MELAKEVEKIHLWDLRARGKPLDELYIESDPSVTDAIDSLAEGDDSAWEAVTNLDAVLQAANAVPAPAKG